MSYKLSGTINEDARLIVISENNWTVENSDTYTKGEFNIIGLSDGDKLVLARNNTGKIGGASGLIPLPSDNTRGVFVGGGAGLSAVNTMDYITIASTSNATDFGDLTAYLRATQGCLSNGSNNRGVLGGGLGTGTAYTLAIQYFSINEKSNASSFGNLNPSARGYIGACSNGTNERGLFCAGYNGGVGLDGGNAIEYITISTTSNSTNAVDISYYGYGLATFSNGTNERALFCGGGWSASYYNNISYVTINSLSNAQDFGDMTLVRRIAAGTSNTTNERGIVASSQTVINNIEYITINTTGNGVDFGDLSVSRQAPSGTSNGTSERGVFGGGYDGGSLNIIDYITISTIGNASDFGDLSESRHNAGATSNAN